MADSGAPNDLAAATTLLAQAELLKAAQARSHDQQLLQQQQQQREEKFARAQSIFNEAVLVDKQQRTTEVAKLQTRYLGSDKPDTLPVQQRTRAFLITEHEDQPRQLKPGLHKLSTLVVGEKARADAPRTVLHKFACVCTIRDQPITTTVTLPDHAYLLQHGDRPGDGDLKAPDVERAVKLVGIRSADGYFGRIRLQLEFIPTDPVRLIDALQNAHEDVVRRQKVVSRDADGKPVRGPDGQIVYDEANVVVGSVSKLDAFERDFKSQVQDEEGGVSVPAPRTGWFGKVLDLIRGRQEAINGQLLEPTKTLTVGDLYPLIRFELMRVVATAIGQYPAKDLYDNLASRSNVEQDIKTYMEQTLRAFGLELSRVSALQFHSEHYLEKLEIRQEVALKKELEGEKRSLVETNKVHLDLAAQEEENKLRAKGRVDRVGLDELTQTDQEKQKLRDQRHQAELARAAEAHQQGNRLKVEDARTDADAMAYKVDAARQAFELYKDVMQFKAEQERQALQHQAEQEAARLRLAKELALPTDQLLAVMMSQNPQLAQAFVAAKQAQSVEDRVAAERQIRDEISRVHGDNRDRTYALMLEAAKQIGHVTGKLAERGGGGNEASAGPPPVRSVPSRTMDATVTGESTHE